MEGRELRRCYTQMEFPVGNRVVRPQLHFQQMRGGVNRRFAMPNSPRIKYPPMEIYRPPIWTDVRTEMIPPDVIYKGGGGGKQNGGKQLNVHAKEFVMNPSPLQTSKSTGDILISSQEEHNAARKRSPSKSSGGSSHVQPVKSAVNKTNSSTQTGRSVQWDNDLVGSGKTVVTLKRSKSMSATHYPASKGPDISFLDSEAQSILSLALQNPDDLGCVKLMELAKKLVGHALANRLHAERVATCCMKVIQKEDNATFLESLLNICQYSYEQNKGTTESGNNYYSLMAFLIELYGQFKLRQSDIFYRKVPPSITLLTLLVHVCESLLKQKTISTRQEIECLFFVVTTVGRDLESEMPKTLDSLMCTVRDAFLFASISEASRKTLLQLIELRAAKWQLPAMAIMYYQH